MPSRINCIPSSRVRDVCGDEIGNHGLNYNLRIEGRNLAGGGDGFGQRLGCIGFIKQGLALQVAGLNVVPVDDANSAHAGAGQQGSQGRAGCPAPDQRDPRGRQLVLPLSPIPGKSTCREYLSSSSKEITSSRVQTFIIGAAQFPWPNATLPDTRSSNLYQPACARSRFAFRGSDGDKPWQGWRSRPSSA